MRKLYSLLLLTAALVCLPWSVKAATTVFSEGFEGDLSNWTKQSCHSSTGTGTEAKYSGSMGFLFNYNTNPPQYLISKELSVPNGASNLSLTFYYKAYSGTYPETFKVGYSTTTNDVTGDGIFTWDAEVSTSETKTTWTQYSNATNTFTIPAGVKYIAIAYTASNQYKLYIDDIELTCNVSGPSMAVLDGETALTSGHSYNFGLATAGTTKVFTLKNDGTEPTPVAIAHTGDFGVELSAASIPAGGSVDLTVTMPATSGSDVITISSTSEAIADFTLNVSGTIRDPNKLWCNFSEGLPEGWTHSSYTFMTSGAGEGTSGGGYATQSAYGLNRLSTPKVVFAENEKLLLLVSSTSSWSTGTMEIQYSANGTDWTTAKTVSSIANGHWTSVEVTEIPAGTWYIGFNGQYVYVTDIYGGTPAALVKNVAASAITDTEATISWTAHGSETAWQVSYSTTSGDPDNGTIVEATSTSKVLEGLTATTTYYVSVRIGDSGVWSNEISFTTACGAVDAPIKWTFEGLSDGTVPSCWDNSGSGTATTGSYLWSTYKIYNTSIYTLRLYNAMVQGGTALINTPSIIIPAAPAAYEFAFEYSHKASCGAVSIMVSDDSGENWTIIGTFENESGSTGTSPDEFTEKVIDLTSYAGKTIILQFFAEADYNLGAIFVKNVEIRAKSSCPAPKSVLVSNITANTASVAWTEKGEATAWKLQTSTNGTDWSEEIAANANPFTLTDLTAQTTYYVRVKAVCSELESSEWSNASDPFDTKCEAKALPFEEGFESALSECWEKGSYWSVYTYSGHSGSQSLRFTSTANSDLVLPAIVLDDDAQLTFWRQSSYVSCSVYANSVAEENKLGDFAKSTDWAETTVDLSAYKNQTVTLIIRGNYYSGNRYLYIDDVKVDYAPIATPANLVAEAGNASATITWAAVEGATSYNFRYREYNAEPEANWTVENLTANSKSLTELTNGKTYEVQVQAVASANRKSDWTASATFTPVSCPTVTAVTFGAATYNSVVVNWTASATGTWNLRYKAEGDEDWTALAEPIAAQTTTLNNLSTGVAYTVQVKPSCSDAWVAAAEAFTPVYSTPANAAVASITDAAATASWDAVADAPNGYKYAVVAKDAEVNWASATATNELSAELSGLDALTDYDFYVAAVYGANRGEAAKVSFKTVTIAPKNLEQVGESTTDGASFSWEANGAATKYQWSVDNTNWSDAQTALTVTVTGLNAGSSYTFYVRSYYSESVQSDAISLPFTTECATVAIGWSENFGTTAGQKPNCWNIANWGTSANYWTTASDFAKTGQALRYYARTLSSADAITPSIVISDKSELKFYIKNSVGSGSAKVECKVLVNDGTTTTEIADITTRYSTATLQTLDLSAFVGKTITIIFRGVGYDTSGTPYLWIDDVEVAYASVAVPTALAAEPKNQGATVTWESTEEGAKFNLQYRIQGEGDWTVVENLTAKTYTIDGLTNGTEYEVQVQAVASANRKSDWTASANFTPAACPSVTAVTFGAATYNSVVVNWTASATGTWDLHYKAGEGEWTLIENINALTTTLNNLTTNAVYTVEVKPTCSDAWVAAASTFTPVYSTPANAAVASITDAAAAASWDAVADAPNGYKYAVVAKDAEVNWESATATSELTAALSSLNASVDYDFYVAAVYGGNLGTAAKVSFKTITIAPANLQQDGASTTSSATFTWEANGAATKYQWSVDNTNWSEAQTELTAIAEGLNAGSSYTFYVRSYYSESVQSAAISLPFTTECEAKAIGWTETFATTSLPACWSIANSTSYGWAMYSFTDEMGTYCPYFSAKATSGMTDTLQLPAIELTKYAVFTFDVKNPSGVTVKLYASKDGGLTLAEIGDFSAAATKKTSKSIDLSGYKDETITMYFIGTANGKSQFFYVNNFEVAEKPEIPSAISNAEAEKKAIKLIENNQLVIIHNGVRYNALGEKIQ